MYTPGGLEGGKKAKRNIDEMVSKCTHVHVEQRLREFLKMNQSDQFTTHVGKYPVD